MKKKLKTIKIIEKKLHQSELTVCLEDRLKLKPFEKVVRVDLDKKDKSYFVLSIATLVDMK